MASFYIPLSGLNADSTALNTISNDLSNMSTTAFKAQTTNFSDLFYQQVGSSGSGDEIQVGGGVQVASNQTDFAQGSYDTSGTTSSDVALDGNGFFVVNDGGTNVLTRDGSFTQNTSGNLVTADGLAVMGYPATNGVVDTSSPLAAINIPVIGQVQQPQATTTFGMTATLDSQAAVGTSVPGQVQVYDSLGNSYEATVTYTKTGTNEWSYSVSLPDSLTQAASAAATAATLPVTSAAAAGTTTLDNTLTAATPATGVTPVTQSSSAASGQTTLSYNLSTTGGTLGTVDQNTTSLTITGTGGSVTVAPSAANESATAYAADITSAMALAGVTGVSVNGNATGQLSFAGTTGAFSVAGNMNQDLAGGTTNNFTFNTGGTVDPSTNLTITGQTAAGVSATITAPTVTAGETMTEYANALTGAISAAGIVNVTVTPNTGTGQLSIAGANLTTANSVVQDLAGTTTNYDFGSNATVGTGTNLKITGQTASGGTATITAPTITAGETVAQYAAALTTALGPTGANIVGVKVSSAGGQLSITGANASIAGSASQDLSATTLSYNFGSSGGAVGTVDPSTNLTITGQTPSGSTATITAPVVTSGETIAEYATALTNALSAAGISGVQVSSTAGGQLSIVGANITSSGSVIQDPVASAGATGTLTFNSSGNLVSPAANVDNITFSGLSDGAANMNMTWNILGSAGTPSISQVDATSSTSGSTQNGFASGSYKGFSIGSDGTVTASYSNGQTEAVGQLALGNVTNTQGLALQGNGDYATTLASGAASIGVSGTDGLASMQDSTLEESNVNISAEFSDLIIAQRAFEASAKSVTTFDTVTEDTINMVH
jgi:flagellar hook protein FlgE